MVSGSPISFGGLASGLDSQAIIDTLISLQRRPISLLQNQKSTFNRRVDLFGTFETRLNSLQTTLENLQDPESFKKFSATSDDTSVVAAQADGDALGGVYDLAVKQLAQRTRLSGQGYADLDTTTIGTGTFSLTVGTETTDISIASGDDTLNDLVDAINASDAEVRAEIVNVGGANPYRIVLSGKELGEDNAVTVDASGLTGGDQDLSFSEIQSAQNSKFDLNGIIDIERASNSLSDVIEGVTLDLLSVSDGNEVDGYQETTVSVNLDKAGMTDRLRGFINSYNDVARFMRDQGQFDVDAGTQAPLFGDFTLRSVQRSMQGRLSDVFAGNGSYDSLASIGLKTKPDGSITLDESVFHDALDSDLESVVGLFSEDGSIGGEMIDYLDSITDSVDGLIKNRKDNFKSRIKTIDERIASNERRIDTYAANLRRQYASLEGLVGSLQVQGQTLGAFFG